MLLFVVFLALPLCSKAWIKEMENKDLYQGDMMLSPDQMQEVKEGKYTFGSIKDNLWPTTIAYDYHPDIAESPRAIRAIEAAFKDYEKYTCLRFVRRTTEPVYMWFIQGNGCYAWVGKQNQEKNIVSLGNRCWSRATAIHEIGHSLGFHHEQSRPDRDNHLKIHFENIIPGLEYNFRKARGIDSRGTPYDYFSVMHYGKTAFGKRSDAVTMETTDPYYQDLIGTGSGFSEIDITQVNLVYKCPAYNGTDIPLKPTPECHDTTSYCEMMSWRGDCEKGSYWRRKCPISCGLCVPGCVDKHSLCHTIVDRCTQEWHRDWMRENCQKTCHLCPGDTPLTTTTPPCVDTYNQCDRYAYRCKTNKDKRWMKINCRRTCGWCSDGISTTAAATTTTTTPTSTSKPASSAKPLPANCKDKLTNCSKVSGGCNGLVDFMKRNCMKTCNYC